MILLLLPFTVILFLQGCIEACALWLLDKEHLFNNNILFCLTCTLCLPLLMSQWLSSFSPVSDLIILSIALFKNSYSHAIILLLKLHTYHCFTSVSLSVYSGNSLLLLSWIFPTSLLTFTLRYRIFWLCGCWVPHEHNKLQHILVEGFLKYIWVFLFFNFKILIDALDMKTQQLGFQNSLREAWLSCMNFLPSWSLSDNPYTSFFTV